LFLFLSLSLLPSITILTIILSFSLQSGRERERERERETEKESRQIEKERRQKLKLFCFGNQPNLIFEKEKLRKMDMERKLHRCTVVGNSGEACPWGLWWRSENLVGSFFAYLCDSFLDLTPSPPPLGVHL
jgi:hypothetical protein